ncbi:MAG: hypothetical protein U0T72_01750 [Chitinophagales bacterium]
MKKFILSTLAYSAVMLLYAQVNLQISIDPLTSQPPFRVKYGDSISYSIEVLNTDSVVFAGSTYIGFKGSNTVNYDSVSLGILQIAPGSSVQKVIQIDVKPAYFKTGPEVVVVWPIFDGKAGNEVADFILVKDVVNGMSDVEEVQHPYFISSNILQCMECISAVKRVRIFDLAGRIASTINYPAIPLGLEYVTKGMYIVQVEDEQGKYQVLKWWVQ